jgi:hypothetical protein
MLFSGRAGHLLSFLPLAVLLLAGCVSSRTDVAVVQQSQSASVGTAPQTRPTQQTPQPAQSSGPRIISKNAAAGQTIEIMSINSVNPDCTPDALGTIKITQQPAHGKAVIVARDTYPSFPANNPRAACNKTKVPGLAVDYTPDNGFTGSDLMAVEAFFHSGNKSNEIKVMITVN